MESQILAPLIGSIALSIGIVIVGVLALKKIPLSFCIVGNRAVLVFGRQELEMCSSGLPELRRFIEERMLGVPREEVQRVALLKLAIQRVFLTVIMLAVISLLMQVMVLLVLLASF